MRTDEANRQFSLGVISAAEYVQTLTDEIDRLREFVQYVRDGNVGHVSVEGIEWADSLLAEAGRNDGDPPCPGCGMTAQVEPSRSESGRWMCHGCAKTFGDADA